MAQKVHASAWRRRYGKDRKQLSLYSTSCASKGFGRTTRTRREGLLHESEKRSSVLTDTAPAMIWSTGPDLLCDYFNQSWLGYRGRTLEQEIGQGWIGGIYPDDLARCLKARDSSVSQRQSFQIEYRLERHDRVYRWILDTAGPWFWPAGVFRGYVGTCVEIHERKLAEENLRDANAALTRQNKDLSEFAYAASHDLKEPLRTIANYTQLLAKNHRDEGDLCASELLPVVFGSVQRMQTLIGNLLEYSQVMNRPELRLVDLDLNMLLEQVLLACHGAISESAAVITHDALPTVCADEAQIGQLLQNLISNAIKFRQRDTCPRVHISAALGAEQWLFQVADNGIGFDPQYSERIFALFKRLHGQSEYSGSGVGLAICRKIIERHGGHIWAESEPGQGARFFFTLRRKD
jgi:PAS domain S-box-containing protein